MAKFNAFTRGCEIATSFTNGNIKWSVERIERYPAARRKLVLHYMKEWMKHDYGAWDRFVKAYQLKHPKTIL